MKDYASSLHWFVFCWEPLSRASSSRSHFSIKQKRVRMKTCLAAIIVFCLLASVSAGAQSATFQTLPFPQGETWASFAISADGKTVAADFGGELFRWTEADG